MPITVPSLYEMAQAWKLLSSNVWGYSHIAWRYSPLLMGHDWLTCPDWGVLRDVLYHQRLQRCPVIYSITSLSLKFSTKGEIPGPSHLNLSIYNPWNLGALWASPITDGSRQWPPLQPTDAGIATMKSCHMIQWEVTIYLSTLIPSLSFPCFFLSLSTSRLL